MPTETSTEPIVDEELGGANWKPVLAESRTLLRTAGPIVLSQIGAVGLTTMDTVMVGPLGARALAVVGLSSALHWALLVVTSGTLFGMAPMVSQAFGAGRREACRRLLVQGLWLAILLAAPMVVLNWFGHWIALTLGQDPAIAESVGGYMRTLAWGVPAFLMFIAFRQYLEGMSMTKPAMVITLLGLGANFVGNAVLIYGAGGLLAPMGVIGCAWATTVVRWLMLSAMAVWVVTRAELNPFRGASLAVAPAVLRHIVRIGGPAGVQFALEVGFFAFAGVMMGWYGPIELGTHQVALNMAATTFMVPLGISLAGSIRVGQRIGARDVAGTRRAVLLTYVFASTAMAAFALLFLTIPERLLRLYTQDPAVVELGVALLFFAALFQILDGAQVAGVGVLRGAADTRVPMLIAAAAYWLVGAPAAYLLGFRSPLGPSGVWAGMVLGLVVASVLLGWRVWLVHWRWPERART
jgi:multidrug resistance protein, MATE family